MFLFFSIYYIFNFICNILYMCICGLPQWLSSKRIHLPCRSHRRHGFDPWVKKSPWRRAWQPTPVFLPGESHGQRSLVGYNHRVVKSQTWPSDLSHMPHTGSAEWLLTPMNYRSEEPRLPCNTKWPPNLCDVKPQRHISCWLNASMTGRMRLCSVF